MTNTQTEAGRRVVAQISTTLDGRVSGPKGPSDMEVVARYAGSDAAHARSAEALVAATTALLGRVNYEGFYGYWPPVAVDETADPRDRNIARWLDDVEKVVFSRTMTDATWANSRIAERGPVEEVRRPEVHQYDAAPQLGGAEPRGVEPPGRPPSEGMRRRSNTVA
jgi:hypothetical protein